MRTIVVGGVAGGASAAARLRRLDETMEIAIYERGEYISFANCGLPYHIGGAIPDRDDLLVQTPEGLRARFNLEVKIRHEVLAIDRARQVVRVRDHAAGRTFEDRYDRLVLSPGAAPFRPALPGIDLPGVFGLRTMGDMDRILAALDGGAKRAVVVGGGFIGIEVAEALVERGLAVTLVEAAPQVLAFLDPDLAAYAHAELVRRGIDLRLAAKVRGFSVPAPGRIAVDLGTGPAPEGDFVLFAIGVQPETALASACGLEIGESGGILVDGAMRTSDPNIFAVGDAVEHRFLVTGLPARFPLAGPANRQGRVAADAIGGRPARYAATQGTGIVKVFDLACASTGASAALLAKARLPHRSVVIHAGSHAGYYPGATPIHLKLIYSPVDGKILGAQAVGADGVDKRIDVLAAALRHGATVRDLADYELCYAPPYGSAKDPVNVAGFVATNDLDGLSPIVDLSGLDALLSKGALLLDVRQPGEVEGGTIGDALAIPLPDLRGRLAEIPRDRTVVVFCKVGLRGHVAVRILRQHRIDAVNLTGGYESWRTYRG